MMVERVPDPIQFEACGSFGEFFPSDDPLAPWMFRTAIIRDDLAYEIGGLGLDVDDGDEEVWRCSYFIRKLCVTLHEASLLFEQDVQKYGNRQRKSSPRLTEVISRARTRLGETKKVVEPIRNALGAHIRPTNAFAGSARNVPAVAAQMLAGLGDADGRVCVDFRDNKKTNFRGITKLSVMAIYPDTESLEELVAKHIELRDAILLGTRAAIHAIDLVLASYWVERDIIKVPPDFDLVLTLPDGWPNNVTPG